MKEKNCAKKKKKPSPEKNFDGYQRKIRSGGMFLFLQKEKGYLFELSHAFFTVANDFFIDIICWQIFVISLTGIAGEKNNAINGKQWQSQPFATTFV